MADKFPSLPLSSGKQRVFSIDLARFVVHGEERAAVVTSERGRLVLYWSKADGSWGSFEMPHQELNLTPRGARDSRNFRWTPRVGVVTAGDRLLLVYKRKIGNRSGHQLWLDLFVFDAGSDSFARVERISFPRGDVQISSFGWNLWADSTAEQLLIMVQAYPEGQDDPQLVLLRTNLPLDAPALGDGSSWTVDVLDLGGWDFAARREGQSLAAIHRRVADSYSMDVHIPTDLAFGPINKVVSEDAEHVSPTLSEMVTQGLVLVEFDLASGTISSRDGSLPFGENPQIHRIAPLIATVDRLQSGRILMSLGAFRFRDFRSDRFLVKQTSAGWRAARLLDQRTNWPRYLQDFARIQQAFDLRRVDDGLRISWSALWSLRPIVLFSFEADEKHKATLLAFGHQDSDLCALRVTTFRVFEDGDTLKAQPETFTLLDIGHRHIAGSEDANEDPPEYLQLRPHLIRSSGTHVLNFNFRRVEESGNTMNGFLVAAVDRPESFYAYTELGDGGPRVVFDGKLELPPPIVKVDEKIFQTSWVSEPPAAGRAWVRLSTSGYVDTDLPGYFITPRSLISPSLATQRQIELDGLPFVADRRRSLVPVSAIDPLTFALPSGGDGRVHYLVAPVGVNPSPENIDFILLTPDAAADLQDELVFIAPAEIVESNDDQPFRIEIHRSPFLYANDSLNFEGVVPNASQAGFQFDWTVSDGTTASGPVFLATLMATSPDFSLVNPGETLDDITVTLDVTDPNGQVSTVSTSFPLPPSLWATVWEGYKAFRQPAADTSDGGGDWESFLVEGMFVRDAALSFFRYRIRFLVDEEGNGTRVELSNRPVHASRLRFLENVSGQGDTVLEVPIHLAIDGVRLTGDFGGTIGNLIQINSIEKSFDLRQRFTTGVQTSEQRDAHSVSETIQNVPALAAVASALCCLPVGESTLSHGRLTVDFSLTAAGWSLGILVTAVIAVVGTALLLAILLPIVIVVAPAMVIAGGIALIVDFLIGAGLGAFVVALIQERVLRPYITHRIGEALSRSSVVGSLQSSGLLTYAGEGLAEAIALKLIAQAQEDDHPVVDPLNNGRDRFRSPFFETIVIGEDECKAQLRV